MINAMCYTRVMLFKLLVFWALLFVPSRTNASCSKIHFEFIQILSQVNFAKNWAQTTGAQLLGNDYLLRIEEKLQWGSKDLRDRVRPYALQTQFHLLVLVIKTKLLGVEQVSRLLEIPPEVVRYWVNNIEGL